MARRRVPKAAALVALALLAVLPATSTGMLIRDYFVAKRRLPDDKAKLQQLELAVRTDASQAAVLTAEYERQRDATLERRDRTDFLTGLLIVSSIVFLVAAKAYTAGTRPSGPSLKQIEAHRGMLPQRTKKWWTIERGASDSGSGATAPEIDLGFVERVVAEEGRSKEAAIAILQRVQSHYRYLPDEALERVCELTDISPAQVCGISSFYAQFRRSPVGKYVVKICHGTACHVAGATEITDEVRRYLNIAPDDDTDPDRMFTIDRVACVGCCTLAPVAVIEDETVGRLSPATASEAVGSYLRGHKG